MYLDHLRHNLMATETCSYFELMNTIMNSSQEYYSTLCSLNIDYYSIIANEGLADVAKKVGGALKAFALKVKDIIVNLFNKLISFIRGMYQKIKEKISGKPGEENNTNAKPNEENKATEAAGSSSSMVYYIANIDYVPDSFVVKRFNNINATLFKFEDAIMQQNDAGNINKILEEFSNIVEKEKANSQNEYIKSIKDSINAVQVKAYPNRNRHLDEIESINMTLERMGKELEHIKASNEHQMENVARNIDSIENKAKEKGLDSKVLTDACRDIVSKRREAITNHITLSSKIMSFCYNNILASLKPFDNQEAAEQYLNELKSKFNEMLSAAQ